MAGNIVHPRQFVSPCEHVHVPVSEMTDNPEMPQSQTADQPTATQGRDTDHRQPQGITIKETKSATMNIFLFFLFSF